MTDLTKTCENCGQTFKFQLKSFADNNRKYCSNKCRIESTRKKFDYSDKRYEVAEARKSKDPGYVWGHTVNLDKHGRIQKKKDKKLGI